MLGVAWGEYLHQVPGSAALFSFGLNQLVAAGLKPPPPQRYPPSQGRDALQSLADGGVFGKEKGAAPSLVAAPSSSGVF